ncbi:HlyD family type I secretion periplasmic adaptor subunit [Pseudovibrio exalbescens]|uniref:HlyD family type I secretion periplasmic adaptor subunit n=1 Tax=Pseudovibrio exalbescens TaxID=197461 RepID=UPI0023662FA9|nr:HlyD family type I secretion periplasmic adaptor subunit [Pseudovibrio exalbescens]MDD7909610.1 HlyD family type I secretion periplasmic adaptor subunit [Pseudovibrio exalbescens]
MIVLENDRHDKPPRMANAIIFLIIALLVVGGTWSAYARLEEVTRGEGTVIPAGRTQVIQASETGNVQEIFVEIGQSVSKGDLLFRLDDTTNSAALGELTARSRALRAQIARLRLEVSGAADEENFQCPDDITEIAKQVCENELRLFRSKRLNLERQLETIDQRQQRNRSERLEIEANIAGLEESLDIVKAEMEMMEPLVARKIAPRTDLLRLQREMADIRRQQSTARESLMGIDSELAELESQKAEIRSKENEDILNELTERISELSVITESIRAAERKLAQTDTYAPVDGIVNKVEVNTNGAFVTAGTPVLEIVPIGDRLLFEAKINPKDIAFIHAGQQAVVKITAYDFATYGGLDGRVTHVGADVIHDEDTGEAFYSVIIESDNAFLELQGQEHPLMPGMFGQVDILTGEKTILAYLMEPLITAQSTALRER